MELEQGWHVETDTKVIFRKYSILEEFFAYFGWGKTEMTDMYRMWGSGRREIENLRKFLFPFEHDNFFKPEKYPFYYKLSNGWKIKRGHEKYLKNGPLFSEDGRRVIVPEAISWKDRWWGVSFGWLFGIFSGLVVNYIYDFLK